MGRFGGLRTGFGTGCGEFWGEVLGCVVTQFGFAGWRTGIWGLGGCVRACEVGLRGWMGVWGIGRTDFGLRRGALGATDDRARP